MINKYFLLTLVLLFSSTAYSASKFINGKIISVSDGDTATLLSKEGKKLKIRFYGIDTPEKKFPGRWPDQAHWIEAKKFISDMILDKPVTVRLKGEQTYGRHVGEIFFNGYSVNREILRNGWGWWNTKYAPKDLDLKGLQENAKLKGQGLWSNPNAISPWEHRRPRNN